MAGRKETTFTSALWAWPSTCFLSACNVVLGRQAAQVKRVHSTPKHLTSHPEGSVPGGKAAVCPGSVCGAAVGAGTGGCLRPLARWPYCPVPWLWGLPLPCGAVKSTRELPAIAFLSVTQRAVDGEGSDDAGENHHKPPFLPPARGWGPRRTCPPCGRGGLGREGMCSPMTRDTWSWPCLT